MQKFFSNLGRNQSVSFVPSSCPSSNLIGINCTTSNDPCNMLRPCQNNATCLSHNHNHTHVPYICSCPPGFAGVHCESDQRPCQSDTCWNNGQYERGRSIFDLSLSLQAHVQKHRTQHLFVHAKQAGKMIIVKHGSTTVPMLLA